MVASELHDCDVLIVGAGAAGLFAALSAKKYGQAGTRVIVIEAATAGRAGHTVFSNGGTIVAMAEDDHLEILREIVAGNEGIADQELVSDVLAESYERVRDLEDAGVAFHRSAGGEYSRTPTRGLDTARKIFPVGGGLAMCWQMRLKLESLGVTFLDRFFVTDLLRDGDAVAGAAGIHARTGAFRAVRSRVTIVATNSVTFRPGFARDITGTGTLLASGVGATLRNAEFAYARPGTPNFYFEGITDAVQDGAHWTNEAGDRFMRDYEPEWGDEADVPRVTRAMALERQKGHHPLYLDMSGIPELLRDGYLRNKVPWMAVFYRKLDDEARTNMFGRTPYYPMNQMTKMGVKTDRTCASDVPGLLVAGLAQAGCANHFAGFHITMANGTGWIAGRSAIAHLERRAAPKLRAEDVTALESSITASIDSQAPESSDSLLREIQTIMLAYDVSLWKRDDRLQSALGRLVAIKDRAQTIKTVPHPHEFVRLRETRAMIDAAEIVLKASLAREESRLAHLREDYDFRDDSHWLAWVDVSRAAGGELRIKREPIPTPLCDVPAKSVPKHREVKGARR